MRCSLLVILFNFLLCLNCAFPSYASSLNVIFTIICCLLFWHQGATIGFISDLSFEILTKMPIVNAWPFHMRGKKEGTVLRWTIIKCEGLAGRVKRGKKTIWCGEEKRGLGWGHRILVMLLWGTVVDVRAVAVRGVAGGQQSSTRQGRADLPSSGQLNWSLEVSRPVSLWKSFNR